MPTELTSLELDEVSGVDHPAHGVEGWMVIKSADGAVAQAETQLAALYANLGAASVLEGAPEELVKAREAMMTYIEKQLSPPDVEPTLFDKIRKLFHSEDVEPDVEKGKMPPQFAADWKKKKADAEDEKDGGDDEDTEDKPVKKEAAPAPDPGPSMEDIEKSFTDAVEKSLAPLSEDLEGLREVIVKMIDRIENVEDYVTGSAQEPGQDDGMVYKSAPTLRDGILSAAMGNRVTFH